MTCHGFGERIGEATAMKRIFAFTLDACEMAGYVRAISASDVLRILGRRDATVYPAGPETEWPGEPDEDLWIQRHLFH